MVEGVFYGPALNTLSAHNVPIIVQPADDGMPTLVGVIINWFPMLLLIGVWVFFLRQMQAGGGKAICSWRVAPSF